jgi:hypothetical protein
MHGFQSTERRVQLGTRYPKPVALGRLGVGIWLLSLTAIFYWTGHGNPWEWLLVVGAALHFCLAYRLFRVAKSDPARRVRFH